MISRAQRLVEAAGRQQLRADMASRRVNRAVFELRLEAAHLAADGWLLDRLDALDAMIARVRGAALRAEVEHQRLRGLVTQATLHGQ